MQIILDIDNLRNSSIKEVIDSRMKEFEEVGKKENKEIFKELCFCLMTANFSAEGGIKIQKAVGDGFLVLPEDLLASKLRALGHRFPNMRAKFVVNAREKGLHKNIKDKLNSFNNDIERREFLVENVKGLGMKESSHFLRNIGYKDVAIIDFHIIDLLVKNKLIEEPKTITPKKYVEIEEVLKGISKKTGINLGELDLYLWYLETGKILK